MSAYESYNNLQKSVQKTETNLEFFSSTLKDVDKCMSMSQLPDGDLDTNSVLDVLNSMSTVKKEYTDLRQDLQEVQQLQREMATTLQYQMRSMTQTYNILKKRLESSASLLVPLPQHPVALRIAPTAPSSISLGPSGSLALSSSASSPPPSN